MPKGQKSSATSGTRKKNARKATQVAQASSSTAPPPSPVPNQSKPKAGKSSKLSKREAREQRKKVYIPPTKPAPPVLDPLDTTGLAHLLPPELVVVLRALGKKDAVTRGKAIEELAKWVEDAIKAQAADRYEEEPSGMVDIVVKMLPVWLHRAPVLFTHPARRLRHLAVSLHASLLRLNPAREALLAWTSEIASQGEVETLLGTWAMLAHDVDRGVTTLGMKAWTDFFTTTPGPAADSRDIDHASPPIEGTQSQPNIILNPPLLISLLKFVQRTVLDPQGLHIALNPAPVVAPAGPLPQQGHKGTLQNTSAPQGKGVTWGNRGNSALQSQKKKSGRYVPRSSDSLSPIPTSPLDRVTADIISEESDSDRAGRLRISALGVVKWIIENWPAIDSASAINLSTLTKLLSSSAFWSTLYPATDSSRSNPVNQQLCPFSIASFGQSQPQVRHAAWALVRSLVGAFKGKLPEPLIRIVSTAVLRSAWVETDLGVRAALGGPLMLFLRDYSQAWMIDVENASRGYNDLDASVICTGGDDFDSRSNAESGSESDSESETDGDSDGDAANPVTGSPPSGQLLSEAYTEFLEFLELGCSGSPIEGYPLVLIVLAGIPQSILPIDLPPASSENSKESDRQGPHIHPISQLLMSFWAPLNAGLLDRRAAASSWLKALTECLPFIVRRGMHTENITAYTKEDAKSLLASQATCLWTDLVTKRLRVEEIEGVGAIARAAERVEKIGDDLFDAFFDALYSTILDSLHTSDGKIDLTPTFLHAFTSTFAPDTHAGRRARSATEIYLRRVVEGLGTALDTSDQTLIVDIAKGLLTTLVKFMNTFGPSLFDDEYLASHIDAMFTAHSLTLLQMSTPGVLTYLGHRSRSSDQLRGQFQTQVFWTELLGAIASSSMKLALSLLPPLVGVSLPIHLRGANAAMDELVERLVSNALATADQGNEEGVAARVLSTPGPFLSPGCLATIASMLSNNIVTSAEERLRFAGVSLTKLNEVPDLAEVGPAVGLAKKLADSGYEFTGDLGVELYAGIFLLGFVIPFEREEASGDKWVEDAKALWSSWVSQEGERQREMRDVAGSLVKEKLKCIVIDEAETRPEYIIRCITPTLPGIHIDPLKDILPSREEFDSMLDSSSIPSSTISPSLALFDSTLPTSSGTLTAPNSICRKYARAISALLAHLTMSRTIALSNFWALRHILTLGFYAKEYLRVEDIRDVFVTLDRTKDYLKDVVEKVKSLTTYLLGRVEDDMHTKVVNALMSKDRVVSLKDESLASFIIGVVRSAQEKDKVRDTAVLGTVLEHLFSDATKNDADLWLALARRLQKTAPQTSITILASITAYAPEPPKLDRYRNELAASLIGVRPGAASTTGLITIRLLAATAPDPDSDVVFLQPQRAVNVMKACQAWVAEDDGDGVDEDVESAMTLVFFYLVPILQNVPGSHWDFIWDVIENNLEYCSVEDTTTLVTLGRTLRLIIAIDDLASTNKPLRANWNERKATVLGLIRDLVAVNTLAMPYSEPRTLCRELALSVIQDMPSTMMSEKTLPSMCHLLGDQSQEVQQIGYHFLHNAAQKRTEHYVIEAGVDTEDVVKPELPHELLAMLQRSLISWEVASLHERSIPRNREVSGYLLAWMIAFDLFTDASMKVRSGYFNHMRSLDIVSQYFIPNIFDILGLFSGGKQVFKLDVWAVDEFHLQTFEPESQLSLQLLAAHLYHRALLTVPALVRSWISDCTDRQLLARVVDYTSSYFSPGIIKTELAQVRRPDASSQLSATENLTVKVSPTSGEVTASYMVDEQALELSIRMPSDWPLHRLEVRDTKMVGVSEDRWRAWILGVQQVVWQQNGRVVDGLTLFTKNVTLHFSGQVECAICYSIISVMDATLPQKPCKTCKNRFHASCLYKWFKTSHSSSCPLCRSDIL